MTTHVAIAIAIAAVGGCARDAPVAEPVPVSDAPPGATTDVVLMYASRMGDMFRPVELELRVDGRVACALATDGARAIPDAVFAARASLRRGRHRLGVRAVYRGNGRGVFSYLRGYRFTVVSQHAFDARADRMLIEVIGYERTAQALSERPQVRVEAYEGGSLPPHLRDNPGLWARGPCVLPPTDAVLAE